jgi:hypothetical protein
MDAEPGEDLGRKRYDAYIGLVYALIDGGSNAAAEGGKYEDRVRYLLGHGGYELATMDKLLGHILKNLQSMASDDTMYNLVQLFRRHAESGHFRPAAFKQEAAYFSDDEPMFAFQYCQVPGEDKAVLYNEYLGVMEDDQSSEETSEDNDAVVSEDVEESSAPPPAKRPKRQRE